MKAAYYTGDRSFRLEEIEPVAPDAGAVQIDVAFCGICGTDLHAYLGHMDGRIGFNRIIGHEMSGRVAALGAGVEGFQIGDAVVVRPLAHCGDCPACNAGHQHICHNLKFLGLDTDGAFQGKWTVPAYTVHKLPDGLSLEHAALVEPLAVAAHDVARARVARGEDVLVVGGGPIGMLVALAARETGASVVLSEVNENRLSMAREMGFVALDPRADDVAAHIQTTTGGKGADVVFEVSGTQAGASLMTEVVAARGRICMVAIHAEKRQIDLFRFFWREIELLGARVYEPRDYDRAIAMLTGGIGAERLITDIRALSEIEPAFKALTENPASMKTLIRVNDEVPA